MDMDPELTEAQELGQQLIDAIFAGQPIEDLKELLDAHAPLWYQAPEDGTSALHAAVFRGDTELVKLLIDKGAIWNASTLGRISLPSRLLIHHRSVDSLQNTAGDIALSLNDSECYELIRDAGLRTGTSILISYCALTNCVDARTFTFPHLSEG
jgi:protein arginine N-methyltransferase 2